ERRKTISGEDILTAFRTLGFDEYVTPLEDFLRKFKEANTAKEVEVATTDENQQMQEQQLIINPNYNLQPLQVFYDAANGQYFIPVQQDNEQIIEQTE
uniref:Uncharacterized protein n=1 Tax=Meloidogyne javanica TaxID=6303 RepID=A0A915LCB1_MELJA